VDPPESRDDVYVYVQRGDITNSSFAFQVDDQYRQYGDGYPLRHLTSGHLSG
jgi:phage head maturation protease